MPKTNATQRSLKHLRANGWTCHIVEKYIKHPNMPFGKRIDAFGIGDILACRPAIYWDCVLRGKPAIALVQCFPDSAFAEHRTKILALPELQIWKAAGGKVFLQGWGWKGKRGEKKRWTLREEEL